MAVQTQTQAIKTYTRSAAHNKATAPNGLTFVGSGNPELESWASGQGLGEATLSDKVRLMAHARYERDIRLANKNQATMFGHIFVPGVNPVPGVETNAPSNLSTTPQVQTQRSNGGIQTSNGTVRKDDGGILWRDAKAIATSTTASDTDKAAAKQRLRDLADRFGWKHPSYAKDSFDPMDPNILTQDEWKGFGMHLISGRYGARVRWEEEGPNPDGQGFHHKNSYVKLEYYTPILQQKLDQDGDAHAEAYAEVEANQKQAARMSQVPKPTTGQTPGYAATAHHGPVTQVQRPANGATGSGHSYTEARAVLSKITSSLGINETLALTAYEAMHGAFPAKPEPVRTADTQETAAVNAVTSANEALQRAITERKALLAEAAKLGIPVS